MLTLKERLSNANAFLRKLEELENYETNTSSLIDEALAQFCTLCRPPKLTKNPDLHNLSAQYNRTPPLHELYKINKNAAIKRIYNNGAAANIFPTEQSVTKVYSELSEVPPPNNWSDSPNIMRAANDFEFSVPYPSEIIAILKKGKQKKSCPGRDKISYKELLAADPEGKILSKLFSLILEHGQIPNYWKIGKTILIPKAGDLDFTNASNWRPIALLNTSYKVFTSCLAHQLQYWVEENKLLHRNQKSLAIHEGCVEHNFALNTMVEHNLKNRIATYICFIDIENAFPSVPYELLNMVSVKMQ